MLRLKGKKKPKNLCLVCSLKDELPEKKSILLWKEKKKKLMPTLLYGFSHQSGNLIKRDSEKKIPGGVFCPNLGIQALMPII